MGGIMYKIALIDDEAVVRDGDERSYSMGRIRT